MPELLEFLGLAEYATHIGWGGVITIGGTSVWAYLRIAKRFKTWLTELIANTPRSKEAQNGLREAVDETRDAVKQNTKELRGYGERIATLQGYVLGHRAAREETTNEHNTDNHAVEPAGQGARSGHPPATPE